MKAPRKPMSAASILSELIKDSADKLAAILGSDLGKQREGAYIHWDDLRHRPLPEGVTHKQWWLAIKLSRRGNHALPFTDGQKAGFNYSAPDHILKLLHEIDRDASGRIEVPELVTSSQTRDRYLVNSLIELSL
jgi:hypothetical protein